MNHHGHTFTLCLQMLHSIKQDNIIASYWPPVAYARCFFISSRGNIYGLTNWKFIHSDKTQ